MDDELEEVKKVLRVLKGEAIEGVTGEDGR
jgi:hypothetical protein